MKMISKTAKMSFAIFAAFLLVFSVKSLSLNASNSTSQADFAFDGFKISTSQVQVGANVTTSDWTSHGNGPNRSGFQDGPAPNSSHVLWKKNYLAILHAPIVIGDKVICAANQQGKADPYLTPPIGHPDSRWLFALNKDTGEAIWSVNYTGRLYSAWTDGNELMKLDENHFMYVDAGEFVIYDANTGALVATCPTGGYLGSPGVYIPELKTWFGIGSFTAHAGQTIEAWEFSNMTNPTRVWQSEPFELIDPRVTYENGRLHVGSNEVTEYALNSTTGAVLWERNVLGFTGFFAAYSDGRLYRASTSNYIFAFEPETGRLLWEYKPPNPGSFICPVAAYGKVFCMNVDGYLYGLNGSDGSMLWRYRAFEPNATQPVVIHYPQYGAVADGKVYWQTADRLTGPPGTGLVQFSCVDATNGKEVWHSTQAELKCPAIADGKVYGQDWIYDRGLFGEDKKISEKIGANLWCFGKAPVNFTDFYTDTAKLYNLPYINVGGEGTSIIGFVVDNSPVNPGVPAVGLPVRLSWYRMADGKTGNIATVYTEIIEGKGKFNYHWYPREPGTYHIIAESDGDAVYQKPAMVTTEIRVEPAPFTTGVFFYVAGGILVIFVIAVIVLRMRKKP